MKLSRLGLTITAVFLTACAVMRFAQQGGQQKPPVTDLVCVSNICIILLH